MSSVTGPGLARRASEIATVDSPLRLFIGYDSHEEIAFEVFRHSILKRSSIPVEIIPLKRAEMQKRGVFWREEDPKQSTEFTYLRFLVPYLAGYTGWAMFVDDDFLCLRDIAELLDLADDKYALMCVKHDYRPEVKVKLADKVQEWYPRKNWSSVILYNAGHPANRACSLSYVNSESGTSLHRFKWLEDSLIGELPRIWNFLTPWYDRLPQGELPGFVHFTEGGPWYPDYRNDVDTDYKEEWEKELAEYEATLPTKRLLCPYERFSIEGNKPRDGYPNSDVPFDWSKDRKMDVNSLLTLLPGQQWHP
mmetsp:Transcript_40790/g.96996  ORF Transcript_40790/g.96996 Transcript_40790/m.96996 type:complete len:307 (+) Transcript_40790:278-1198(+)